MSNLNSRNDSSLAFDLLFTLMKLESGGLMKYAVLFLSIWSSTSFAAKQYGKNYSFEFKPYLNRSFTFQAQADSFEEAYEIAAKACVKYYSQGRNVSHEDTKLDIVDICANPKT